MDPRTRALDPGPKLWSPYLPLALRSSSSSSVLIQQNTLRGSGNCRVWRAACTSAIPFPFSLGVAFELSRGGEDGVPCWHRARRRGAGTPGKVPAGLGPPGPLPDPHARHRPPPCPLDPFRFFPGSFPKMPLSSNSLPPHSPSSLLSSSPSSLLEVLPREPAPSPPARTSVPRLRDSGPRECTARVPARVRRSHGP